MKISYQWLAQFISLPDSPEELAAQLTALGLEVEGIHSYERIQGGLKGVVIGKVITCQKHPNADKLSVTTVDVGNNTILPIVCGAPNVAAGQKVLVATPGTVLYPAEGESLTIKKSKIRGEVSQGMICAEDELGLGPSHDGIMVLNTNLPNGTPAAEFLQLSSDAVFEIGLTPNRADAASHYGVARDLKALYDGSLCMPSVDTFTEGSGLSINISIQNTEACPRYAGICIDNVQVAPSPQWLQHRLKAIGLNPINNIVDCTNYVLHELGQPLHAFDYDQISGQGIVVGHVNEGSIFKTLDGVERRLSAKDLIICDAVGNPLCIAGVFGGMQSGVSNNTRRIFLESAYFSPAYVRATGMLHSLKTDASFRFERGTDPNMVIYALKRAALLIAEVSGGHIASAITDLYPAPVPNKEVKAKYSHIDRLIGKKLSHDFIKKTLQQLDINILSEKDDELTLEVPPYRVDVIHSADIAEEILRVYGLDNIELSEHLSTSFMASFPSTDPNQLKRELATQLASCGYNELVNNSLTRPEYAALLPSVKAESNVEILNRLSSELGVMRQSMLFSGLETIAYNINRRQKDLRLFEFGKTYHKTDAGKYDEPEWLALFVSGSQAAESWQNKQQEVDFFTLSATVHQLLQRLGFHDQLVQNDIQQSDVFEYGIEILLNKNRIASLGAVKRPLLRYMEIKQAVFYAEIHWKLVARKFRKNLQFSELSKFPEVRRDLSLILDNNIRFEDIRRIAHESERKLLQQVNVFDIYQGSNIGEGKKAYSVSFILQDQDKTLTDELIDKVMNRLMSEFEKQLGAVIRK